MPGFILYWRDKVTTEQSPLTYNSKKTLLYLYLAASAEYEGDARGTLETNIKHLSGVMRESYFTTRNWMIQLQKDALISFQRCFKNLLKITICNYDELSGVQKDALKMFQRCFKDEDKKSCDCDSLQPLNNRIINNKRTLKKEEKEKEKINKKEKENAAAEAAAATAKKNKNRQTSIQDVESTLDTDFVAFAESIGFDPEYIHVEYDKWMDWQDSKGKRFTDNKMAFKNWLRNAVKFHGQHTTPSFSVDDIRRLN